MTPPSPNYVRGLHFPGVTLSALVNEPSEEMRLGGGRKGENKNWPR
jgi:hypothetical protein